MWFPLPATDVVINRNCCGRVAWKPLLAFIPQQFPQLDQQSKYKTTLLWSKHHLKTRSSGCSSKQITSSKSYLNPNVGSIIKNNSAESAQRPPQGQVLGYKGERGPSEGPWWPRRSGGDAGWQPVPCPSWVPFEIWGLLLAGWKGPNGFKLGQDWAGFEVPGQSVFLAQAQKIVRKTRKGSRANSSFWFWLEREGQKPHASEGHRKRAGGGWPGCPGALLRKEWRSLWRTQEAGRADRSQDAPPKCPHFPTNSVSPLLQGRGSGQVSFIWVASCQSRKRPVSSARAFVFWRGCGSSREEPLFLQRIFRSAAGFWRPSPPSSPPFFLCGARFPGHKQQMVLFTLEIRLCFSQSHRCPLTASGTVWIMRLLENSCCFILFFPEIGDSLGRPGGQCLQGVTWGWFTQGSSPRELFFLLYWSGLHAAF